MKKIVFAVATIVLLSGAASAQENESGKKKWGFWIEFNFGASFLDGTQGFTDHMQTYHPELNYHSVYVPASTIGIGYGVNYRQIALGLHVDGMVGNSYSVKNQYVKKEDSFVYMDLGYRFVIAKILSLEPMAGFGISTSDIFLSTSRGGADYVNSFTTANFIVPLTLNFLAGKNGNNLGIYLQYVIGVGQMNKAHITGLETEVDNLNFQPATLTFGCKYRF